MNIGRWMWLLLAVIIVQSASAAGDGTAVPGHVARPDADVSPANGHVESRRLLALYDSAEYPADIINPIAENLEVICDHLGFVLDYHDVRQPMPSHDSMAGYRGIVTWFTDWQMADPNAYLTWLIEETQAGRYVVVMGSLGAQQDDKQEPSDQELIRQLYALWGFEYSEGNDNRAVVIGIDHIEPDMFGLEYPAQFPNASFDKLLPLPDHGVEPLLQIHAREVPHISGTVAAVHPRGGFVVEPFLMFSDNRTYKQKWILNPFLFLARALRWQTAPRPDMTTLNGARIFFSHVDGDGSVSLSESKRGVLTVEASVDYFKKLPLPVTLSVVEGEIFNAPLYPWLKSGRRPTEAFRTLFAMDRIGPASHGFTHPLDWTNGVTALTVKGISRTAITKEELERSNASTYEKHYPVLMAPQGEWERRETIDGIRFIDTLLPPNKKCRLFLWTGDCTPSENALKMLSEAGYLNMNGGDGRFDPEWPSLTALAPAVRHVGPYIQVHTAMANENIYTEDWLRNFAGFANVIKTFENTESPLRIKPINVYYHFYSFEKPAAEQAVTHAYNWALKQDIAPMFADQYVEWVLDSRRITLSRSGPLWYWENAGKCRTLRFDNCVLAPDPARSEGIIGWHVDTRQRVLYVHLDGSGRGKIRIRSAADSYPHLERAAGWVDNWTQDQQRIAFSYRGYGRGWVELGGLEPNASYSLLVDKRARRVKTDTTGLLRLDFPQEGFPQYRVVSLDLNSETR